MVKSTKIPVRLEAAQSAAYRQHVGLELADAYLFTIEQQIPQHSGAKAERFWRNLRYKDGLLYLWLMD